MQLQNATVKLNLNDENMLKLETFLQFPQRLQKFPFVRRQPFQTISLLLH